MYYKKYIVVEEADGTIKWFVNGELHRDKDKPAIEDVDGNKWWYLNGKLHRDNGEPAIELADGTKKYYLNGIEYNPKDTKAMTIAEREEALGYIEELDKAITESRENLDKLKGLMI